MIVQTVILSCIYLILSGVHFYWLFGGAWGINSVIPTNKDGKAVLNPGKIDTIVVALGLLYFSLFYLIYAEILVISLPQWLLTASSWGIPSIFILRAVGDFKYVGAFKRIKGTPFAEKDSKFFSPLCFVMGLLGFYVLINS